MKKVIFLGAKKIGYECFDYLIKKAEEFNFQVVGLLSNNTVKRFASGYDLAAIAQVANVPVLGGLEDLCTMDYDILISVQFHEILKKHHIESAKEIAVNLHMAPLPEYRGCNQFSFAIIDEAKEFGTTIHKMEPGIDSGDILFERRFPIPDSIFVEDLYEITYNESVLLFQNSIGKLISGDYTLKPQSSFHNRPKGFHLRNEIDELKKLDLSWPRDKIERYIRATSMPGFDGPYFTVADKKLVINLSAKREL